MSSAPARVLGTCVRCLKPIYFWQPVDFLDMVRSPEKLMHQLCWQAFVAEYRAEHGEEPRASVAYIN